VADHGSGGRHVFYSPLGCFAPHYCLLKFCALITVQKSEDEDEEKNEEDEEDE
jgi:hypothetical protein